MSEHGRAVCQSDLSMIAPKRASLVLTAGVESAGHGDWFAGNANSDP